MTRPPAERASAPSRAFARLGRLSEKASDQQRLLVALVLGSLAVTAGIWAYPTVVPMVALLVPLVVASLVLGPRLLPWFVVFVLLLLTLSVPRHPDVTVRVAGSVVVMFALGFFVLLASFRRSRLGVAGAKGESMLVDLRDRILRQGGIPELPEEWYVASELRSAGGTPFAGDFVVAVRSGERLDVAVVDVSGKGEGAGTRALLLSGALGGLLGAMEPPDFLPAANAFLLRQDWDEGFATAVHLSLDLASGDFEIRYAGHPPAAMRSAGSGRWKVLEQEGPILGLIAEAKFAAVHGHLERGDGLMLYTDGMVETPTRELSMGIDRMLGQAELLLRGDFVGGAAKLIAALGSRNDDRALLLVHRR